MVNAGQRLWDAYAVRAWPTLVIIGADGLIVGAASGEPDLEPLLLALRGVLGQQRAILDPKPLPLTPEGGPPGTLAFPGGIAAGADEIYVADTGHHQVVAWIATPARSAPWRGRASAAGLPRTAGRRRPRDRGLRPAVRAGVGRRRRLIRCRQ